MDLEIHLAKALAWATRNEAELQREREENTLLKSQLAAKEVILVAAGEQLLAERALAKDLAEALARIHDESCVTKYGRLNMGPMIEPSEAAVLKARDALERYRAVHPQEAK